MSRKFFLFFPLLCWSASGLCAQEAKEQLKERPKQAQEEAEPPEEDESLLPKEYSLNPVQSSKEVTAGNFYFKKGNFKAAAKRYLEATKWDSGSAQAFFKLGEAQEKLKEFDEARKSFGTYLELANDAKVKDAIDRRMAKWPKPGVASKK